MEDKFLWTPGTIALWNDKKWIEKRIHEQGQYKRMLDMKLLVGSLTKERYGELDEACKFIFDKFVNRWQELKQNEEAIKVVESKMYLI